MPSFALGFVCITMGNVVLKITYIKMNITNSMQNEVQIDVLKTNKDHLSDFQVTQFAAQ